MTPAELQALSRAAAVKLPARIAMQDDNLRGRASDLFGACWLHESTEACAEIMVRVLWPRGATIGGNAKFAWREGGEGPSVWIPFDDDPMQAFRVAVLRAMVAL